MNQACGSYTRLSGPALVRILQVPEWTTIFKYSTNAPTMNGEKELNNSQLTILLIDDEPGVLFALRLLIQTVGYAVREFSDPLAAIEFLKGSEKCDAIICDLRMPKLDGLGVLQEAKRLRPNTPFILMSGHAQAPEIDQAQSLGSAGFLGKPFSPQQLKEMIASIDSKRD